MTTGAPARSEALNERHVREIEYHKEFAKQHEFLLAEPFSYEIVERSAERWWNAYWHMYAFLSKAGLAGRRVLVIGCGFGEDALWLAKMGADVHAFDLSPEVLDIAERRARRERLHVSFDVMPAEAMTYRNGLFDCVLAQDILHHTDIAVAMREIVRVSRAGALLMVNEVYSHSFTEHIRRSWVVDKLLYPRMSAFVYQGKHYITDDERKLTEKDIRTIKGSLAAVELETYFNCIVSRVVPNRVPLIAKLDRLILHSVAPISHVLGGRVLLAGPVAK